MKTKYIHMRGGIIAMFSERSGLFHVDVVERLGSVEDVLDAGFVDYYDGNFRVYGRSTGKHRECTGGCDGA